MASIKLTNETGTPTAIEGRCVLYPDTTGGFHARSMKSSVITDYLLNASVLNRIADGRLTLTSGVPVLTSDVLNATTVYYTPYIGNMIALYYGGAWGVYSFTELTLSLSGATASSCYDVFCYLNSGVPALTKLIWTSSGAGTSARATALVQQDGVYVKSGDATQRYLGTIYVNSAGGKTDIKFGRTVAAGGSLPICYLWNYNNQVDGSFVIYDSTATWNYTTATWRQRNNSAGNQFNIVSGNPSGLTRTLKIRDTALESNTTSSVATYSGLGLNKNNGISGQMMVGTGAAGNIIPMPLNMDLDIPIGYSYIAQMEFSIATGTTTWYGGGDGTYNSGSVFTWWY